MHQWIIKRRKAQNRQYNNQKVEENKTNPPRQNTAQNRLSYLKAVTLSAPER